MVVYILLGAVGVPVFPWAGPDFQSWSVPAEDLL